MADLVGIATWHFREDTLVRRIERFAEMGFDAICLSHCDACAMCNGLMHDVEEKILARGLAVSFCLDFMSGNTPATIDTLLLDLDSFLQWNGRTGALYAINYEPAGMKIESEQFDYDSEMMHGALKKILSLSNGEGFSVAVRDWPRNADQLAPVAELRAYPHFGILIDLGALSNRVRKAASASDLFPEEFAQRYLDRIPLPISELRVRNSDNSWSGTSDLAVVGGMLKRKGVRGISTIEISPLACCVSEDEALMIAKEAMGFWKEVG